MKLLAKIPDMPTVHIFVLYNRKVACRLHYRVKIYSFLFAYKKQGLLIFFHLGLLNFCKCLFNVSREQSHLSDPKLLIIMMDQTENGWILADRLILHS